MMALISISLTLVAGAMAAASTGAETLYAHCKMMPGKATLDGGVDFRIMAGSSVMEVKVNISSMPESQWYMHGLHVHEYGDLGTTCGNTGDHFNPTDMPHGDRSVELRHVGDFGNVMEDGEGNIHQIFTDEVASLTGPNSIIGRSVVIHEKPDDLQDSITMGNAGFKLACCTVGFSDSKHWDMMKK